MGTKKQAEKSKKNWTKIIAIIVGVLFVVLMVVSSLGSSWISSIAGVKTGDVVTLDYTIRDASGTPLVTSSQQVYQQMVSAGSSVIYSKQLTVTANQTAPTTVVPVQVYAAGNWDNSFALFANEYDAISSGILGMKTSGQKTIPLISNKPMSQFWTVDQLAANNMSISSIKVGQQIALGISDNPTADLTNSTTPYYIRLGEITNKTAEGVTIDFAYPSVDVTVVSIKSATS
ncbi:MAG: hypothetical protein LUQ31_09055 [Methanoregula sp.]|nr:hypothetical protein [Methanoregula sp.]